MWRNRRRKNNSLVPGEDRNSKKREERTLADCVPQACFYLGRMNGEKAWILSKKG